MSASSVNNCPVFVSSSDAYADLWPAFFTLFKQEWPHFSGIIYLNTETKDYAYEGPNIVCTKIGKGKCFGAAFKAGLKKIKGSHFLLLMIDYFIEQRISLHLLQKFYDRFISSGVDASDT